MKKLLLILFCLISFNVYSQTEYTPNVTGKCFISQSGSGVGYWQINGIFTDESGLTDASNIDIGDVLFFTDSGVGYFLPVTSVLLATPPSFVVQVNKTGISGIVAVPTTSGAIYKPTQNYELIPYVSGLINPDQQTLLNYNAYKIDQALSSTKEITDYIGAEDVKPAVTASGNTGDIWRNSVGQLYRSTGTKWLTPVEFDSFYVVAGQIIIRNQSGADFTVDNIDIAPVQSISAPTDIQNTVFPDGINLIKIAQQGATNGQVLKWNTGMNKWVPATDDTGGGGGGGANLTYFAAPTGGSVNSDSGTDATLPLADVVNAGLYPSVDKILEDVKSVKQYAIRNSVSTVSAFNSLVGYYSTRGGNIIVDTTVNLVSTTTLSIGITVEMVRGGKFIIPNAVTLTINGIFKAEPSQECFNWTGTGNVAFSQTSVEIIWPYWFGAKANDSFNCQPSMQKAIDVCMNSNIRKMRLLAGTHRINKGLLIKQPFYYATIDIEGVKSYDGGLLGTCIRSNDTTSFGIGIQGARAVKISNILFTGFGADYNPSMSEYINNSDAIWRTQWGRDNRYSPNAAIVIDPFSNTPPPGGGYPTFSGEYVTGNSLSSNIVIENILARYWICGICISPSTTTGNGSEVVIKESYIDRCKIGLATCQTQSRSIDLVNSYIVGNKTCMDGMTFGNQTAPMPNSTNCQFGACKDIIRFSSAWGDGKIVNMYGESIYRIGLWEGNKNELSLMNCDINFTDSDDTGVLDAASVLESGTKINVMGGYMGYASYRSVEMNVVGITLTGTTLQRLICNNPDGGVSPNQVTYNNCKIMGYIAEDQQNLFSKEVHVPNITQINGYFGLPKFKAVYTETGTNNQVLIEDVTSTQDFTTLIDVTTVTINNTLRQASFTTAWPGKYRIGDILTSYNNNSTNTPSGASKACSFGIVSSIVGNVITTSDIPGGLSSGGHAIYLYQAKVIIPTHIGNITSGSNKVVVTSKGNQRTVAQMFPVGVRIYYDDNAAYNYGLLAGSYVTSVVNDTIFLSQACNATLTGIELFGASARTTFVSQDNTYQTAASTYKSVGYRAGDRILFKSHPYRAEGVVNSGGFTPSVKFLYKPISGTTGSRPTPELVDAGLPYFNTTTNTQQVWNGTVWKESGAIAPVLIANQGISKSLDTLSLGKLYKYGDPTTPNVTNERAIISKGFSGSTIWGGIFLNDHGWNQTFRSVAAGDSASFVDAVNGSFLTGTSPLNSSYIEQYKNQVHISAKGDDADKWSSLYVDGLSAALNSETGSSFQRSTIEATDTAAITTARYFSTINQFKVFPTYSVSNKRIDYTSNLSAQYNNNTLVQKSYVDNHPITTTTRLSGLGTSGSPLDIATIAGLTAGNIPTTGNSIPILTINAQGQVTAKNEAAISFPDASSSNEGVLSVGAGTSTTSTINSNTSSSPAITLNAGSGLLISENTGTSNITLTNSAPDQTVILTGAGITAITGTYPTFTVTSTEVDGSTSNEIQNLSLTGQTLGISLGGTSVTLPVVNVTGSTRITATPSAGNYTLDLASQGASSGDVLKWNGTSWSPGTDNTGGGGSTLPLNEIGYGTGAGITSDANFVRSITNNDVILNGVNNANLSVRTVDTSGIVTVDMKSYFGGSLGLQKPAISLKQFPITSSSDNPASSSTWLTYDPNGLAGNIPTGKKFGKWYEYALYQPDLNTPGDPADTTGDMIHIMGYNLGLQDNASRGSTWLQFEQDYNQVGSPHTLKDLMEFHLNHRFLDNSTFRTINANATTDGKYIESALGGDFFGLAANPKNSIITNMLNWDNRTRYIELYDTCQFYFRNRLPGAIIEKYRTTSDYPLNIIRQNSNNSVYFGDVYGASVSDTFSILFAGGSNCVQFKAISPGEARYYGGMRMNTASDRFLSFEKSTIPTSDYSIRVDGSNTWSLYDKATIPISVYTDAGTDLFSLRLGKVSVGQSFSIPTRFSVFQSSNDQGGGISLVNSGNTRQLYQFIEGNVFNIRDNNNTSTTAALRLSNSTTDTRFFVHTGNPESTITANPGEVSFSDGGNLYIKKTGTGNTGWESVVTSPGGATTLMREESFTATAAQTTFTLASYTPAAPSGTSVPIRVYRNGVKLKYVASGATGTQFSYSGAAITITACIVNDIITIEYLQ